MGDSNIEWTDATWNPVTGCTKVSPGCAHCYAETVALRFWPTQYPPVEYDTYSVDACCPITEMRVRAFTDVMCHEDRLDQPLRWRKPRKVFVNSMSDLFHEDVPDAFIDRVFAAMALAPQHTFQVLTKRAERMRNYFASFDSPAAVQRAWNVCAEFGKPDAIRQIPKGLPNVWLGVSVENQHFADERIPLLLQTPAAVRFISAEPLLGPVDLTRIWRDEHDVFFDALHGGHFSKPGEYIASALWPKDIGSDNFLDWVIVGGESGHRARPFDVAWARSIVAQCKSAGVPCFVKQLGSAPEIAQGCGDCDPCLAGQRCYQSYNVGLSLHSKKGGEMAEWPKDLRVREFPVSTGEREARS